jgi:ribosomal protein S18 acetylase RimI-like enzyme
MEDVTYRPLTAVDAPAVYDVALEAWQYTYRDIYDTSYIAAFVHTHYASDCLVTLVPQVASGAMFFQVAVAETRIVGFCHIGITADGVELRRIYLRPGYIGRGIGRALLQRGEAFVAAHGFAQYFCFVHQANELGKRFYLRHGFRHRAEWDQAEEWYIEKTFIQDQG